jgi:FkbH-like protein
VREFVNLTDALEILKQPLPDDAAHFRGALACSFTPLHLQTFLRAHLRKRLPGKQVDLDIGLFGDLQGNVERLQKLPSDALFVAIEWQDVDSRLGIRTLGGWRRTDLVDIVESASEAIVVLKGSLARAAGFRPVYISTPTLPLPPLFSVSPQQASGFELQLRQFIASFASSIAEEPGIRVISPQLLDEYSPLRDRFDVRSEVQTGFPYKLPHASSLAEVFAALIGQSAPRKGLITDLDDTLWAGILGEVGPQGISWDLEKQSHLHGIYQQFLESLASAGVLVAVASKNDMQLVDRAFERTDLGISKDNVFPFEVHWSRKSESVRRILQVWNISADAVVFLDDSPMEVAEVKQAFPEMECRVFPKGDYEAFWALLTKLRQDFGKSTVHDEDLIRAKSIRDAEPLRSATTGSRSLSDFLQSASASIRVEFTRNSRDHRAFELVNKTNQFNLNGKRLTEAAWSAYFDHPTAFLMTVTYEDKFGPLGKIAALLGKTDGRTVQIDFWVMSCRAFSRRVEHQTLRQLFEKFEADEIRFDYQPTPRNVPLEEFFADVLGASPQPGCSLLLSNFLAKNLELFQRVEQIING